MRRTRALTALLLLLLVPTFAACGDDDEPVNSGDGSSSSTDSGSGEGGGDGEPSAYDGEYVGTEVIEDGQPRALVEGTTIRLRLDAGTLTASAGCNTIGGSYTVEDDVLVVRATSMTEMGCGPALHAQDEWLAGVLSSSPDLEATQLGFLLETDTITITFTHRDVVESDRELVGTRWLVDGYVDGTGPDGTSSSAPSNGALVVFDESGFVLGHDGCNELGYGGPEGGPTDGLRYEVDDDRITFTGAAASTLIGCPDVDTDRFWAVLTGTVTFEVDADRLTLTADDGRGVTFRAE